MGRRRQRERKREGNRRYRFAEEREEEKEKEGQKVEEEVCSLPFPFPPLFFPFSSLSFLPSPPPLKSGKWEIVSVFFVWEPQMNLDIFWELFKDDIEVWRLTAWQIPYRIFPPSPFFPSPFQRHLLQVSLFPKALFCRVAIGREGGGGESPQDKKFLLAVSGNLCEWSPRFSCPAIAHYYYKYQKVSRKMSETPTNVRAGFTPRNPNRPFCPKRLAFLRYVFGLSRLGGEGQSASDEGETNEKKGCLFLPRRISRKKRETEAK